MSAPTIGFIALGCAKATVDAERLLSALRAAGYHFARRAEDADLVIVNTCGFIEEAIEESLEALREALAGARYVIATGCLGARKAWLEAKLPQLTAVFGPEAYDEVLQTVFRLLPPPRIPDCTHLPPRSLRLTPKHYAWLKIAEGCNHDCSFCIIPQLRGPLRSRPLHEVVAEAEALVRSGAKELLVVAQDTAAYGMDLRHRTGFVRGEPMRTDILSLVDALSRLGVWVRLHYVYPYPFVDALVQRMREGKILPYLDIPLQHASHRILRRMKRPAAMSGEAMLERIARWRAMVPSLAIRSTFIVGFPGETDEDFADLLDFIEKAELDRVGVFCYSPVEGAAANAFADPVPKEEAERRAALLMQRQAEISRARLARRIGRVEPVLIDGRIDETTAVGRSPAESPEIDGVIAVEDQGQLKPGDLVQVKITDADEHNLAGVLVEADTCASLPHSTATPTG
ncbi:MAG: 30S ribosomal protein S12 methylthiotransferase RimO [Zetaproteobacteria bacterium]|nr:MAG: 30S ribosomal protein S12 methylthiotransferase RimO [Zetaproteobacteria bacterium]